jgi:hypothetical protein
MEESMMSSAELETRRSRWFCVAGRPLKLAGALLDKSAAGEIKVGGGETISRTNMTSSSSVGNNNNAGAGQTDGSDEGKTSGETTFSSSRNSVAERERSQSRLSFQLKTAAVSARAYLPPIVRMKFKGSMTIDAGSSEHRNVVIAFVSLPGIFKQSARAKGVDVAHLNDTYSALLGICSKHEGKKSIINDFGIFFNFIFLTLYLFFFLSSFFFFLLLLSCIYIYI